MCFIIHIHTIDTIEKWHALFVQLSIHRQSVNERGLPSEQTNYMDKQEQSNLKIPMVRTNSMGRGPDDVAICQAKKDLPILLK